MNIWWASVVAPEIKAVGLCHSVYWTVHDLGELIGVPIEETHYRAAGVNHQAWLLEWTRDGEDLYPLLRAKILGDGGLSRRVRVEIFRRLGLYPTETSEHSSEYLPWFLRSPQQIERYRLQPLEYIGISEENVAEFEQAQRSLAAGTPLVLEQNAAEYAPQVIHSMVTGTCRRAPWSKCPQRWMPRASPPTRSVRYPCSARRSTARTFRWPNSRSRPRERETRCSSARPC